MNGSSAIASMKSHHVACVPLRRRAVECTALRASPPSRESLATVQPDFFPSLADPLLRLWLWPSRRRCKHCAWTSCACRSLTPSYGPLEPLFGMPTLAISFGIVPTCRRRGKRARQRRAAAMQLRGPSAATTPGPGPSTDDPWQRPPATWARSMLACTRREQATRFGVRRFRQSQRLLLPKASAAATHALAIVHVELMTRTPSRCSRSTALR